MKQKILTILSFIFVTAVFSSCIFGPSVRGNGNVIEEQRKTGPFDEIKVSRGMNVYISQGDVQKIVVEADENLMDYIETNIEGNALKVTTSANIRNSKSKKVFVTVTDISKIHATAGSNIFSETEISANDLDVSSTAGSNIKLSVSVKNLDVSASAGANIMLEGQAENATEKASAGSNIKSEDLTVKDCSAHVSSGANIWVKVTNEMEGKASSGGNVFYYGEPASIDSETSSGGNVIKK